MNMYSNSTHNHNDNDIQEHHSNRQNHNNNSMSTSMNMSLGSIDSDHSANNIHDNTAAVAVKNHNQPWPYFRYPAQWEKNNEFMCVHFLPKSSSDDVLWKSQLLFWSEAVSAYAEQLLFECKYKAINKLSFTMNEIEKVYTRHSSDASIHGMKPMCIADIVLHFSIYNNNSDANSRQYLHNRVGREVRFISHEQLSINDSNSYLHTCLIKMDTHANANANTNTNHAMDTSIGHQMTKTTNKHTHANQLSSSRSESHAGSGSGSGSHSSSLSSSSYLYFSSIVSSVTQYLPPIHTLFNNYGILGTNGNVGGVVVVGAGDGVGDMDGKNSKGLHGHSNKDLIWIPTLHKICAKIENIAHNYLFKIYFEFEEENTKKLDELKEIIDIGILVSAENEIIINGYVFNEYCMNILRLTISDINIIKTYLQKQNRICIYYENEFDNNTNGTTDTHTHNHSHSHGHRSSNSKHTMHEMIKFKSKNNKSVHAITERDVQNMKLISIQLTIKYLQIEQKTSEQNLKKVDQKLLKSVKESKLKKLRRMKQQKHAKSQTQTQTQTATQPKSSSSTTLDLSKTLNKQLLMKRKLLKNRIQKLMISIANLDKVVLNIEDHHLNANVFQAMQNANQTLQESLAQSSKSNMDMGSLMDLHQEIEENIAKTNEISAMLAEPIVAHNHRDGMDVELLENDNADLESEYSRLLLEEVATELPMPPIHDVVIKDKVEHNEDIAEEEAEEEAKEDVNENGLISTAKKKKKKKALISF